MNHEKYSCYVEPGILSCQHFTDDFENKKVPGLHILSSLFPEVAFSAQVEPSTIMEYDMVLSRVITNVGEAYNSGTGKFVAPYNGTYHFTLSILSATNTESGELKLKYFLLQGDIRGNV